MSELRAANFGKIGLPKSRNPARMEPRGNRSTRPVSLPIVTGVLRLVDILFMLASGAATAVWIEPLPALSPVFVAVLVVLAAFVVATLGQMAGAYRHQVLRSPVSSIAASLTSWAVAMAAVAALALSAAAVAAPVRHWLALWALAGAALLLADRLALLLRARRWRGAGRLQPVVAILGAGAIGQRLVQKLTSAAEPEVRILGFYDDRATRVPRFCFGHPIRGTVDDLLRDVRAGMVDSVFVALPLSADWRLAEIMNKLSLVPVDVRLCADAFGFQFGTCGVTHVNGLTLLDVCRRPLTGWQHVAKSIEDKVLASIILVLIAPMLLAVAALVKLDSPGPAFFRQKRYGLNNKLFEVIKFRTLYHNARDMNAERLCVTNDSRITRVGAVLRRTMIDELPQLINVLRGEMSMVGPRPHATAAKAGGLLYQEVVKYYDARHRIKPGITGWAQVNGWRGETRTFEDIQQRVAHDLDYIQHWSVLLDLTIILRTALGVFVGFAPRKLQNIPSDHALPLADLGRPRSAA